MTEFELIRTYFAAQPVVRPDVAVGIGDDAAVICPPAGMQTVITTDVLVGGVHFFQDADPVSVGYKSLAVNLSDLAAMGAEPAWFLLDLTLPEVDSAWLRGFADGLYELARRYHVQLIGGDTSRGPLAITITAIGLVPEGRALLRSGARPGDVVCVTGTLGDAALALALATRGGKDKPAHGESAALRERLERPLPRVAEGIALRDLASSAIDISDGLLADLGHVLAASGVGARLTLDAIPVSAAYRARLPEIGWDYALAGGDDYELCFTVPSAKLDRLDLLVQQQKLSFSEIGTITSSRVLEVCDATGRRYQPAREGHDHFARG